MKKIILIVICILLLTGCSKEKYLTCTSSINNKIENYNLVGNYRIYYKDNFVTRIIKDETYTSDSKKVLDYFYQSKDLEYSDLNDKYSGIIYNISYKESSVKIDTEIDFKKIDLDSMSRDGKLNRDYIISGNLTLSGIKKIYQDRGIVCE